ncbi:hypothetical protein [Arthrobacter woluwensis]|uniref:hypothetical protein n=1 Tax=Arthrobacter woluwensis TaxID=156980 RepID=UPI0038166903
MSMQQVAPPEFTDRNGWPIDWLADVDEPIRTLALAKGWAPDLTVSERDDIMNEAEACFEDETGEKP